MTRPSCPSGHENIPHLLEELLPQATFFTQVVNRGILGHYVANASLATGAYETLNNFIAAPPQHPTVFEYFRKDLNRPSSDAWVIAPSIGFERIGESHHAAYGPGLGANVVLPKRLLASAVPAGARADYESLLHDNYESPLYQPEAGQNIELERLTGLLKVSVSDFLTSATEPGESGRAVGVHRAPGHAAVRAEPAVDHAARHRHRSRGNVFAVCRCDPPHRQAVRRDLEDDSERARICRQDVAVRPSRFRTGFGRDAGGNGFQHHRTGDARSRTTWMLALGPDIRDNVLVDRPIDSMDLVPTLGSYFGFSPRFAEGRPVGELF